MQAALTQLATTGCDVAITELDTKGAFSEWPAVYVERYINIWMCVLGTDYTTAVKACLNVSKCIGVTVSINLSHCQCLANSILGT